MLRGGTASNHLECVNILALSVLPVPLSVAGFSLMLPPTSENDPLLSFGIPAGLHVSQFVSVVQNPVRVVSVSALRRPTVSFGSAGVADPAGQGPEALADIHRNARSRYK